MSPEVTHIFSFYTITAEVNFGLTFEDKIVRLVTRHAAFGGKGFLPFSLDKYPEATFNISEPNRQREKKQTSLLFLSLQCEEGESKGENEEEKQNRLSSTHPPTPSSVDRGNSLLRTGRQGRSPMACRSLISWHPRAGCEGVGGEQVEQVEPLAGSHQEETPPSSSLSFYSGTCLFCMTINLT